MNSITKNRQSLETLIRMVKCAFGNEVSVDKDGIKEMDGGYCNAVYQISLPDQDVILKIGPHPDTEMMSYEVDLIKTEVRALRLIGEKSSVPVPKVLFCDESKTICSSDYFFMSKVDGQCYEDIKSNLTKEENESIKEQIGSYCRQMNQLQGKKFQIFSDKKSFSRNSEFVFYLFEQLIQDGERKNSKLKYITFDQLRNIVHSAKDALDEVKTPCFVHWDLWDGNVFIKDGKVEGIIDFERALWGDPMMEHELSFVGDPDEAFLRGCGQGQITDSKIIRRMIYTLYRELSMIVECDYRSYEDDSMYVWIVEEFKKTVEYYKTR